MAPRHSLHLLVDGHSVIFAWEELRRLHQGRQARAREELVRLLTSLHDASHYKVTVVFDGKGPKAAPEPRGDDDIQVIYSQQDQSADAVIERMVGAYAKPHLIHVVSDDTVERTTVESLGAHVMGTESLRLLLRDVRQDTASDLSRIQQSARRKWTP